MISNLIQMLWIGNRFSSLEQLSISSFLAHSHEVRLYVYERVDNVPSGVIVCDAEEIISRSEMELYGNDTAHFADLFRYELLYRRGGWWSDTDVVCVKHFDFETQYVFASERDGLGRAFATNGVIRTPPGADIMLESVAFCRRIRGRSHRWGESGPHLLHRLLWGSPLGQFVQPPEVFSPLDSHNWVHAVMPGLCTLDADSTYGVHLWNEMWRRAGLDKDATYAPSSFYESLKLLYGLSS